jgi:predicted nucleotidyltransferase
MDNNLLEGFLTGEEDRKMDYTTINNVLSNVRDNYKSASVEGIMKDLQGAKIMSIKEVIDDINELIGVREKLQKEVFGDIDKALSSINNFLNTRSSQVGPTEELSIREKLLDLETFRMQEKINAFRDIAALKKELRDRVQEYKEQEHNATVLDNLLQG